MRHGRRHIGIRIALPAIAVLGAAAGFLEHQARSATARIAQAAARAAYGSGGSISASETSFDWRPTLPSGDGIYLPDGSHLPHAGYMPDGNAMAFTMVGDSTSVGYGCATVDEKPGVVLARMMAAFTARPVRLQTVGVVGSGAADLARQTSHVLTDVPEVVVILVGANDVRDRIRPSHSAAQLGAAVRRLRDRGVPVVVGTCPDLGVIDPIAQPLRHLVGIYSRVLARRQEQETVAAGGVAVPLARVASPTFYGRPDLFYADGFHPNGAGYAIAVAAMVPAIRQVLRAEGLLAATTAQLTSA